MVLLADLVGDEAVLGLLRGALVVLRALLEDVLLHPVDALGFVRLVSARIHDVIEMAGGTFVERVFLPLALGAAAGQAVQLVEDAAAGAGRLLRLLLGLALGLVLLLAGGLVGELVDEVHCEVWGV